MLNQTINDLMDELGEQYFEDITFRRKIQWRRQDLQRILDGERVTRVIPEPNQRKKLRRDGILVVRYGQGGKQLHLTDKAVNMLKELVEDD